MNVAEIIKWAGGELNSPDGGLAAEVLLAHVTGMCRESLFMDDGREITTAEAEKFAGLVRRHVRGEPVAYLINRKEFFGLDFYVDQNVLIPRPETEMLVEKVIAFAREKGAEDGFFEGPLSLLDVGTGCGNIAVSLAKNLPDVHVTASDVSSSALEVAKRNAVCHGTATRMDFIVSDLLENISGDYDVITANLPYIGESKYNFVSREAFDFEPHKALFGGADGLRLYEKLFGQIRKRNLKPALLLGEFGFLQGDDMRALLDEYFGAGTWCVEKDLASIERMFVVKSV